MTELTTLAYSKKLGISKVALFKRLRKGGIAMLPGCVEVKVFPRQTVFIVDLQQVVKTGKKRSKKLV